METESLLGPGNADQSNDEVVIDIAQGRYPPQDSIWKRKGILNGRTVKLITNHVERLAKKIESEESFCGRYSGNRDQSRLYCATASGVVGLFIGGVLTSFTCSDLPPDFSLIPCYMGESILPFSSCLCMPVAYYARHRYKQAKSDCSLWKEKKRLLKVFKQRIQTKRNSVSLSSTDLRDLMLEPKIPTSLKEMIAVEASLSQHFEAAKDITSNDVKHTLNQLMHFEDQASLHILLNPSQYEAKKVISVLSQFRLFFAKHPSILNYFHDHLPLSFFDTDGAKELFRTIVELGEKLETGMDECAKQVVSLVSDKVFVQAGSEKVEVSRRLICKYDRLKLYFPERTDGVDQADSGDDVASGTAGTRFNISSVNEDAPEGATLDFPLTAEQKPEVIISMLHFIDTGHLLDEEPNPMELLKEADFYGVQPLVDACIKRFLDEMASGEMTFSQEEKAEVLGKMIEIFPGPLPEDLRLGVENEYHSAANSGSIEETTFWLMFAKEHSADQLFHQFDKLPDTLNSEFANLIFQMRPAALLKALIEKLTIQCSESSDPVKFMETHSKNSELLLILADVVLGINDGECIAKVWDLACRLGSTELKRKVSGRLQQDPTLAGHWNMGELPDELLSNSH